MLMLIPMLMQAQEKTTNNGRIGFEFGSNVFVGETIFPEQIRAYNYNGFFGFLHSVSDVTQGLENTYGGIKYESFFYKNRIGLTAGLRFSKSSSKITADERGKMYFFWLFRQDETTTDYLKIQEIKQKNNYLGIPLEFRYILKGDRDLFFNQYFKLGAAVNYCLSTSNSVSFWDTAMNRYAGAVEKQIKKPNAINAWIYPAYGFKLGKMKNVWFNMEFHFPGFLIGKNAHPFFRSDVGIGAELSVQIPVNKIIH